MNWWLGQKELFRQELKRVKGELQTMRGEDYRRSFEQRLSDSEAAKMAVVQYINRQGMPCSINPSIMFPKGADAEDYKDGGDLFMHFRTEVKHRRKLDFTCAVTYPFDTIIICQRDSFDKQAVKPRFYFICNGPMSHAALVDVKATLDKWILERMTDHERGSDYWYDAYTIPKDAVKWITL